MITDERVVAIRQFAGEDGDRHPILRVLHNGRLLRIMPDTPSSRHELWADFPKIWMKDYNRRLHIREKHTTRQVFRRVRNVLLREGLIDEYFSLSSLLEIDNVEDRRFLDYIQGYRTIACYPVEGSSEGHYIHVEAYGSPDRQTKMVPVRYLFTGKTFKGMEHAALIARRCAEMLGA